MGIKGLGNTFVYGASRVPFPPASMTAFNAFPLQTRRIKPDIPTDDNNPDAT